MTLRSSGRTGRSFPVYGFGLILAWSLTLAASLSWNIYANHQDTLNTAVIEAESYWDLNLAYRRWAAQLGGVYVPIDKVSPNPYLNVPNRELTTTDNRTLTLVNPAYMTRMVLDTVRTQSKEPILSKITSLKYLNPVNTPDEWEKRALSAFEQGKVMETEVTEISAMPYLRIMKPFVTEDSCLKCHGHQGYKTGDIRGGLSIAIPLATHLAAERKTRDIIILTHSLLWLIGTAGIFLFVRGKEKQRQEVMESEWKYRIVADFSNDWGIWLAEQNEIVFVTPACRDITGYSQEEFMAQPSLLVSVIHPDDRERWMRHIEKFDSPRHEEMVFRIATKSGEIRWISHECGPIAIEGRFFGRRINNRDITESKKAEVALSMSEAHYRGLFENSPVSMWEEDFTGIKQYMDARREEGVRNFRDHFRNNPQEIGNLIRTIRVVDVNAASIKLFRAGSKEDLLGSLSKITTSQSADAIIELLCHFSEGDTSFDVEFQSKTLTGEYLTLYHRWSLVPGYEGTWERVIVSRIDLTALKRAEALVSSILQTVQEGFIVIDRDLRVISANAAFLKMTGKTEAEALGRKCHELLHKDSRPCFENGEDCPVIKTFKTGKAYVSTHEHISEDNKLSFAELRTYPLPNAEGEITAVIETIVDVTEKRRLEEELVRTQRLDSIGVLAGGIAHDFNNSLTGILGYISLLRLKADQSVQGYIAEAEKAVEQAKSLTRQLLTFARGGEPVKKPLLIVPVVADAAKLALSGTNVKYELGYDRDLRTVEADEGQVKQVVQNIVLNAAEAMPEGGTVSIGIRNVSFPEDTHVVKAGNYVEITIRDTGIGIPPQYLSTIFDPYFTTKQKGSGLGLATSFSIMKKHGGGIDVVSRINQGTTFTLFIPASDRVAGDETSREKIIHGKGRILVLEDEDLISAVVQETLRTLGYSADVVATGENALHAYMEAMEKGDPYDAAILDLTIRGGMGGKDTMKGLLALNPQVKAIVSSGYGADPIMANYAEYGFAGCLMKPYRIDELSQALRKVLS